MTTSTLISSSFEELLKSAQFKKLIEQLPKEEREAVEKSIKELLINFDKSVSKL